MFRWKVKQLFFRPEIDLLLRIVVEVRPDPLSTHKRRSRWATAFSRNSPPLALFKLTQP